MNITYTQNIEECTFYDIGCGECFEWEGNIFLRVPSFIDRNKAVTAIRLDCSTRESMYYYFDVDTKVIPVSTELKVTYKCEEVK